MAEIRENQPIQLIEPDLNPELYEDFQGGDGFGSVEANHKMEILLNLFPQADFNFLQEKSVLYAHDDENFEAFVADSLNNNDFPPSAGPDLTDEDLLLMLPFDAATFVRKFPNPFVHFKELTKGDEYKNQMKIYLKNRYKSVTSEYIEHVLIEKNYDLIQADTMLGLCPAEYIITNEMPEENGEKLPNKWTENLFFEIQLLENQNAVRDFMAGLEATRVAATIDGTAFECQCCFADDVLSDEVLTCTEGCVFCESCVQKYVVIKFGDGLTEFPCPVTNTCSGAIHLKTVEVRRDGSQDKTELLTCVVSRFIPHLQKVVSPSVMRKIVAKIQEAEVNKAKIEGIVQCSSCEYAAVLPANNNILSCPLCHTDTCRLCKEKSHIPRKCGETEEEDREKTARKKTEELKTNEILRFCHKCSKRFVKDGGCNKVCCTCGNTICYLCGASGINYDHFHRACRL